MGGKWAMKDGESLVLNHFSKFIGSAKHVTDPSTDAKHDTHSSLLPSTSSHSRKSIRSDINSTNEISHEMLWGLEGIRSRCEYMRLIYCFSSWRQTFVRGREGDLMLIKQTFCLRIDTVSVQVGCENGNAKARTRSKFTFKRFNGLIHFDSCL